METQETRQERQERTTKQYKHKYKHKYPKERKGKKKKREEEMASSWGAYTVPPEVTLAVKLALKEAAEARPADPIKFVAQHLLESPRQRKKGEWLPI